ncbi:PREDICTED: transmembrane epididymal protein 1 [Chrysochloris asiatica]|uniref:Transmembrane epididymal protein 1 n=1 Tax=Chrysochloris asiatica TaxID=185453 RepID=A0A9B0WYH9_CHRAS|nr:PREDICTED: transmembrane epididymal protein 1 [Chrysochloris asiatica]
MENFIGNVCPGLFLVFYGLHQAIVVSKAVIFNDSLLDPSCPPRNKGRWAMLWKLSHGGLLKMVTGFIMIAFEVHCIKGELTLMNRDMPPRFMYPKEWQHLTMFILLTLNGCVDIMSKNVLPQRCMFLELGVRILTFYVLLLLLVSHTQGTAGVELQVHSLLILVVFLITLVLTAELWAPDMFHLWLIETFLFLMMGSWLMQAGFILFKPVSSYPWQDDDMSDIMFVTTFFCWHIMINALCLLWIYGFSFFWYRCYNPSLKLTWLKEAPYHFSTPGPHYKLLQEVEQSEKDEQTLLLPTNSP